MRLELFAPWGWRPCGELTFIAQNALAATLGWSRWVRAYVTNDALPSLLRCKQLRGPVLDTVGLIALSIRRTRPRLANGL